MSKFKIQKPVQHIPSFKEYRISGAELREKMTALGLSIPLGMLDYWYYYTDLEGWGTVLWDLVFKSSLYRQDRFDCENYALKAMMVCAERYGLNTMAMAIGESPYGRHGFNLFYFGEGVMLWEPNEGFDWSGQPFEIGGNNYQPEIVLI